MCQSELTTPRNPCTEMFSIPTRMRTCGVNKSVELRLSEHARWQRPRRRIVRFVMGQSCVKGTTIRPIANRSSKANNELVVLQVIDRQTETGKLFVVLLLPSSIVEIRMLSMHGYSDDFLPETSELHHEYNCKIFRIATDWLAFLLYWRSWRHGVHHLQRRIKT
jgi:hypothetical protein